MCHRLQPRYFIQRQAKIFRSREDVIKFEEVVRLEGRLQEAVAGKEFDEGYQLYQEFRKIYDGVSEGMMKHVKSLPSFLGGLTVPAIPNFFFFAFQNHTSHVLFSGREGDKEPKRF